MNQRVIIVGAGIIGTACAYYLQKSGWQVTIIDQGEFGKGCSHANCGFICPSHVLPLAGPGVLGNALQSLFQRNSPFKIHPRLDINLWQWLFQFARRCNFDDMLASGQAIQPLLQSSAQLYENLFEQEPLECEYERCGMLFVFLHARNLHHYAQTDRIMRHYFKMAAQHLSTNELTDFEPALKSNLAGGFYYPMDTHLRPDKLMQSWRELLSHNGANIIEHCSMDGLVKDADAAQALLTSHGEMTADAFVIATGAWTPLLNEHLGCQIPIQPGKGYSITMPHPKISPMTPLILEEHRVAVTPFQSSYRLGSTMEFAGYDSSLNENRLSLLKEGASHYLQEPYCEPIIEKWFGWRPMTYDSVPIIDFAPQLKNVLIAAGHNMLGLSMAPATGKLVAELLNHNHPHIDPDAYTLRRFHR